MRRILALVIPAVLVLGLLPAAAAAATQTVTGTITTEGKIALSTDAIAVVTLVDQQASPEAGTIIGQQRIESVQFPISFGVTYDDARVDPTHSYALYASVIDGATRYQNAEPVPVITGGPTQDVTVNVTPLSTSGNATVGGVIVRTDKSALTPDAVAVAALVNATTGTLVARQVLPSPTEPITFSILFNPAVIDDSATYVVSAAIVDGSRYWQAQEPQPAIANGAVIQPIEVSVTPLKAPAPTPEPTPEPTRRRADAGADARADARTHARADARTHAGADARADRGADAAAHAHADAHTDARADREAHAVAHVGADAVAHAHAGADRHPDPDRVAFAHARSDADGLTLAHAEPLAFSVTFSVADPRTDRRHHQRNADLGGGLRAVAGRPCRRAAGRRHERADGRDHHHVHVDDGSG